MSSKATLALLIYGIIMHYNVNCSPMGLSYPNVRLGALGGTAYHCNGLYPDLLESLLQATEKGPSGSEGLDNEVYDEDGNSLPDLIFDSDQIALRSPPSVADDVYTLYYPPEKRTERHADGMFNKAYRKALGQLSARKYLHSLMAKRVGGGTTMEDDSEPLSKRHSDGVFTDSYSRYRKQMAVKKYLAAVLGKSPEDIGFHHILQDIDFDALPDGDEFEAILGDWLKQFSPEFPVSPWLFPKAMS